MDIQQLTLIINLLKDVADGALLGVVLYLVASYVLPYGVGVFSLWLGYRLVLRISDMIHVQNVAIRWFETKNQELRTGFTNPLYSHEIVTIQRHLDTLLNAGKK